MTMLTMFLIYPFTLSHEHRHHRHHRHAYSEMTLAVYYCSKQKQWYYEKHKIRMTQMTLMTLNLGYGIGISPKQRHKRHQRHYRHARMLPGGLGHTPEMRLWISKRYASKTCSRSKRGGNQSGYAYKFVYAPEWISLDSSKNLDSKRWISSDSRYNLKLCCEKKKIVRLRQRAYHT